MPGPEGGHLLEVQEFRGTRFVPSIWAWASPLTVSGVARVQVRCSCGWVSRCVEWPTLRDKDALVEECLVTPHE